MSLAETAKRRGALLWFAALVGIGAWMVHLTAVSALAKYACNADGSLWTLHLATVVTAAITAVGIWICLAVMRDSKDDESEGTLSGNQNFVGVFGLITGGFSLLLIIFEGSYAFFLSPCA